MINLNYNMLQFITNTRVSIPVAEQIKAVIRGGCRWVQIRMKDASDEEVGNVVREVKDLCIETETFLLLDDRVELAKTLDVGGVHLGKNDMAPSKARAMLGAAAVIGVTANTFADIEAVCHLDVDYLGLGPFTFTRTKENLAPQLGLDGIRTLCAQMRQAGIDIATVAVGGITLPDVQPLMQAGVNGIAVSGAIAGAPDPEQATRDFLSLLPIKE